MKRHIILFSAVIFICCNFLAVGVQAQNEKPYLGTLGEGYTTADFSKGIDIGSHIFSAPDNAAMCAAAPKPALLITNKNEYVMKVGETFSPEDLRVIAVDSSGQILKPTPIIISIENKIPEVWDLWDTKLKQKMANFGDIRALQPGTFRMLIKPFCERLEKDLIINFTIVSDIPSPAKQVQNYQFVCIWPEPSWRFNHPSGIAIDSQGNVYVADTEHHCVQKFISSGGFITKWGNSDPENPIQTSTSSGAFTGTRESQSSRDGQLKHPSGIPSNMLTKRRTNYTGGGRLFYPHGLAIDQHGNVFVNGGNHNIEKFTASGIFITEWGSYGTGVGQFYGPSGIAVDSTGNVYVVDTYNNRVQKFNSSGEFIATWGKKGIGLSIGDGEFNCPAGIAVDHQGNIYVVDQDNRRIQKFSSSGAFITKWGNMGTEDGEFSFPRGIAVDLNGDVYVADERGNRIQKFTASGTFITKWGSSGTGDGQFNYPEGIAVDSQGNVYVADSGNNRIQKFTPSQKNKEKRK